MAAAAAALPIALPLAEKGIQASVDLAKSVMAQISDALRTPLLGMEQVVVKHTKRGEVRTTTKGNIPAWFALGGTIVALFWAGKLAAPAALGGDGAALHYQPFPIPGFYDAAGNYRGILP